jgi:hypothetical protein
MNESLFLSCIYTIRHSQHLADDYAVGGNSEFTERTQWATGLRIFQEARQSQHRVPILFAPAEAIVGVTHWALIDDIARTPQGTRVRFSSLQPFAEMHPLSSIKKLSDGKPLSDKYIRPYVPCLTPPYLQAASSHTSTAISMDQLIASLTPADYAEALRRIEPTEGQMEMLRVHMAAPNHMISVRQLALVLGFPSWQTTNLLYGKFAGKLCNELGVSPATNLSVLVEFFKMPDSEHKLRLRPSAIAALRDLGIADHGSWSFQEELGTGEPLVEGASFTVQANEFKRNPKARQECIAHHGASCSTCGLNFGAIYGCSAEGYIHVHHLKPLASIGEEYVIDPIKDLRPVCANCHAVIHLRQPPYSIEEVKDMLLGDADA